MAMLLYTLLFALQEAKSRQAGWLDSFLTGLIVEILFVRTGVVFFTRWRT